VLCGAHQDFEDLNIPKPLFTDLNAILSSTGGSLKAAGFGDGCEQEL
jgi:hypothetical protein